MKGNCCLGISVGHDASAAIIYNNELIACSEEERFSRIKHDPDYPGDSIAFCLKKSNPKSTHF